MRQKSATHDSGVGRSSCAFRLLVSSMFFYLYMDSIFGDDRGCCSMSVVGLEGFA